MRTLLVFLLALAGTSVSRAEEPKFVSLFNGTSLEGWKAPDMSYWSVADGAITAESTEAHPCPKNQFLVWQGGEIANFVLRLKFRVIGGKSANSGIQVRSQLLEDGHAVGYQADICQPDGEPYLGAIYDEHGRKTLALRGQRTVIQPDGTLKTQTVETPEAAAAGIVLTDWNEYQITFIGNKMIARINGRLMCQVVDYQESEREMKGILALQLHSGPAMRVQFKDIELKKLPD